MKGLECYMNEEPIHPQKKERPEPPMGGSREKIRSPNPRRYAPEYRLKAVQTYLKGGYTLTLLCRELGVNKTSLHNWVKVYRLGGKAGLLAWTRPRRSHPKLPAPITDQIVALKQQHPTCGSTSISQLLRRWFCLPASPSTVRQRLHEANLMPPAPRKKRKNLTRPRFFERATPNQMWQSDIFTFRLGGRYAYLIAFLDDHSRYVVGADLFRSPTAEAVIEVYRIAMGEFQPPREMLTDNGRQYTSWRGTSRFEAELKKDRVAHIKSRPHHPMTLGKIERFWSTLWQHFLVRAQFASFEDARERIKLWIKYYNHRRPHQSLDGFCPADRFFAIQTELRKTIEAGIQENLLELALRGKPQAPFYMVGRMDGQSVVLRAEKGKLKLSVTNDLNQPTQELTYDLHQNAHPDRQAQTRPPQTPAQPDPQRLGQSPGGAGDLDRTLQTGGSLPPVAGLLDHVAAVAGPGDGRDAPGPGEPREPEPGRRLEPPPATPPAEAAAGDAGRQAQPPSQSVANFQGCQPAQPGCITPDYEHGLGPATGVADPAGPGGPDHGHGGGPAVGPLPQELLPVGEPGPRRLDGVPRNPVAGPTLENRGPGEGPVAPAGDPPAGASHGTGAGAGVAADPAAAPDERR